jgi:hypothetical protein
MSSSSRTFVAFSTEHFGVHQGCPWEPYRAAKKDALADTSSVSVFSNHGNYSNWSASPACIYPALGVDETMGSRLPLTKYAPQSHVVSVSSRF